MTARLHMISCSDQLVCQQQVFTPAVAVTVLNQPPMAMFLEVDKRDSDQCLNSSLSCNSSSLFSISDSSAVGEVSSEGDSLSGLDCVQSFLVGYVPNFDFRIVHVALLFRTFLVVDDLWKCPSTFEALDRLSRCFHQWLEVPGESHHLQSSPRLWPCATVTGDTSSN